jgi:hypothetical protein
MAPVTTLQIAIGVVVLLVVFLGCVWFLPVDHWGFAISMNFLFMAFFSYICDAVFAPLFSSAYFEEKPFERNGAIYRYLGVMGFLQVLRLIGWERLLRRDVPVKKDLGALKTYEAVTKGSEAIHLASALSVIAVTIWIGWAYTLDHTKWLVLTNIAVNVYPVMLQRYNRPRVSRLIRRQERQTAAARGTGGS